MEDNKMEELNKKYQEGFEKIAKVCLGVELTIPELVSILEYIKVDVICQMREKSLMQKMDYAG